MMDAGRSDAAGKRDRRPRPDSEYAAAREVVRRLQEAGHIAVFAGGCVRDMLLGRPIKDYDVATSAHPREVLRHFRKSLKVGIQFGIVVARLGGWQIEVATFRNDGDYLDGRRPESVEFSTPEDRERAMTKDRRRGLKRPPPCLTTPPPRPPWTV